MDWSFSVPTRPDCTGIFLSPYDYFTNKYTCLTENPTKVDTPNGEQLPILVCILGQEPHNRKSISTKFGLSMSMNTLNGGVLWWVCEELKSRPFLDI